MLLMFHPKWTSGVKWLIKRQNHARFLYLLYAFSIIIIHISYISLLWCTFSFLLCWFHLVNIYLVYLCAFSKRRKTRLWHCFFHSAYRALCTFAWMWRRMRSSRLAPPVVDPPVGGLTMTVTPNGWLKRKSFEMVAILPNGRVFCACFKTRGFFPQNLKSMKKSISYPLNPTHKYNLRALFPTITATYLENNGTDPSPESLNLSDSLQFTVVFYVGKVPVLG